MSGPGRAGPGLDASERERLVREGVGLFNAGRYWEAHEALEAVWRCTSGPERAIWQGLIQAAAAMLHRERGNRHGLKAQGDAAILKLAPGAPGAPAGFPVEITRFAEALAQCVLAEGPVPRMELSGAESAFTLGEQASDGT